MPFDADGSADIEPPSEGRRLAAAERPPSDAFLAAEPFAACRYVIALPRTPAFYAASAARLRRLLITMRCLSYAAADAAMADFRRRFDAFRFLRLLMIRFQFFHSSASMICHATRWLMPGR